MSTRMRPMSCSESGVPIVVMPLDVTHKALTTRKRIAAFRKLGTRVGIATAEMLEFFERFDEEKYGSDGGPLHDPCVIAYLLKPELFKGRHCNVTVETASELTMGMTVDRLVGRHQAAEERDRDARHRRMTASSSCWSRGWGGCEVALLPVHGELTSRDRKPLYFALENASHSPPPTRKLPLMRETSFNRRVDRKRPARPPSNA